MPVIFGHRGFSALEPENTLRAFNRAFKEGAQGIEFDVRLTADNEIVIIHDETIDRTSNGSGFVKNFTLSELLKFNFGFGEKIPTLEDIVKLFGNKYWLNIEVKEIGFEKQIFEIIEKHQLITKYVISSFQFPIINTIKELNINIPTALLYANKRYQLKELKKLAQINDIHPEQHLLSKSLISSAHKLNMMVRAWTIDNPETAYFLAKMGIDGIITNNPKQIILFLLKKKR